MRLLKKSACLISMFALVSCSVKNGNVQTGDYTIRYVNLNAVFEYIYENSNEAQDIKRKTDSLVKKIDEMENSSETVSKTELSHYRKELVKAREQEKKLKSEIYLKIKNAVNAVAVRHNADFILNSGEGVIYSRSEYDLTTEVIREMKNLESRRSPAFK